MFLIVFVLATVLWVYSTYHLTGRLYQLPPKAGIVSKEWLGMLLLGGFTYLSWLAFAAYGRDPYYLAAANRMAEIHLCVCLYVYMLCLFYEGKLSPRVHAFLVWLQAA